MPRTSYLMRKVTPYDLYKQLMEMHHLIDRVAYPSKTISKKYFNEKLKSETLCELKDEYDNLVGIGLYYIVRKRMVITTFIIDETVRSVGYGKRLIDEMTRIAIKKKCTIITLSVSAQNPIAQIFYEKDGFTCSSLTMKKELKDA